MPHPVENDLNRIDLMTGCVRSSFKYMRGMVERTMSKMETVTMERHQKYMVDSLDAVEGDLLSDLIHPVKEAIPTEAEHNRDREQYFREQKAKTNKFYRASK